MKIPALSKRVAVVANFALLFYSTIRKRLQVVTPDGQVLDVEHTARQGVAGGYPSLNGSAYVWTAQLGSGATGTGSKFLADDYTWKVGGGGGGAPTDAQYLTLTTNATLTDERTLSLTLPLSGSDGGAGAAYTVTLSGWSGTTDGDMLYRNGTAVGTKTASQARTWLSLVVGTNVQAWDAGLDSLTAADATAGLPYVGSANSWSTATYSGMLSVVSGAWKVVGLRESGGTDLTMGAVADGAVLRRSGTSIVGAAVGSVLQAWAAILDAIAALTSTGIIVRTGSGTVAARTVVSADSSVTITNPGGVAGNIDLSVAGGNSDTDPTTGWWVDVQPTAGTVSSRDAAITVRTAAGVSNTSDQRRTSFTGSAVACDWYFSANVRPSMSPVLKIRFTTGASIAATTRYKMGLTNTGFTTTDVETSTRYMMLRASTALGDTNWKLVTYDGTTATVTDTGVAFAAATEYNVRMTLTSSSAEVDINGTTTSTSATLPASSSDIGLCMWGLYGSTAARGAFFTGARLSIGAYT